MAYNHGWDGGDDSWNGSSYDNNTWGGGGSRDNVRSRDDDYYGEGKRRKYNNGGYDASQAYDESSYNSGYAQGAKGDFNQEHPQEDRSQQRGFQKKRLVPSEPSPHVIFLGLDPDFTEADLQAYLNDNGCSLETVTIIRDKSTGASKGFGFAQFASSEHARAFVDPLFPFIQVPPPASHGASATAAFHKAVENGAAQDGRRVKIDYSQSASPHDRNRGPRQNLNDGTRDIGNAQSAVLLFRGLDHLSGPQAIHQAMLGSSGPGIQGAKGMKRIVLIKDKVTMASFGFAFVEFVDVQSAAAVLAATMSPQIHPSGFRISDRPVAGSFAHPYSFQPVADPMIRDDAAITSSPSMGGPEGTWIRYWDEASTAAILEFKVEEPRYHVQEAPSKEKKDKKKIKAPTGITAPPAPSVLPLSDKPVTLSFSKGLTGSKFSLHNAGSVPVKTSLALGFSLADDTDTNESSIPDDAQSINEENKVVAAKKVAPLIASKKTVNNINKWNHVQEELTHDIAGKSALPMVSTAVTLAESLHEQLRLPTEEPLEFSDIGAMTCLLCARKFKSQDQLERHNKESNLHKENFKDATLRDIARQKAHNTREDVNLKPDQQPRYRDRASERRIMHNQPDVPGAPVDISAAGRRKMVEGPLAPPSPPPAPNNPSQDNNNVGNKLLKMMGWTEGTGLGSTGDGRVDPIQTAIYAQGVGLGASKGKDLTKYAEGYSGYVNMAQDSARERYGN